MEILNLLGVDESCLLFTEKCGELGSCPSTAIGRWRSTQVCVPAKGNVEVRSIATVGLRKAWESETGSEKFPCSSAAFCAR